MTAFFPNFESNKFYHSTSFPLITAKIGYHCSLQADSKANLIGCSSVSWALIGYITITIQQQFSDWDFSNNFGFVYWVFFSLMTEVQVYLLESFGRPGPIEIFNCLPAGFSTGILPDPDWKLRTLVRPPPRDPGIRFVHPSFFTAIVILYKGDKYSIWSVTNVYNYNIQYDSKNFKRV